MAQTNINPEILNLIKAQITKVEESVTRLTQTLNTLIDEEDRQLLTDIILTKRKHIQMLNEMLYRLTGEKRTESAAGAAKEGADAAPAAQFRSFAIKELEDAETYRGLIFDFLTWSLRDAFTEMMTDCQNNANRLNILLTKYS